MSEEKEKEFSHCTEEPETERLMIPKHRFDIINARYKQERERAHRLEKQTQTMEGEIQELCAQIGAIKQGYESALNSLRVKEIFVEGGIPKKQYDTILPKMTCREEEKLELARAIVHVLNQNKT